MSDPERFLPGHYITDGRSLLWVVERLTPDTILVENAKSGEQVEMGDADLVGYKRVRNEGNPDDKQ